MKRCSHELKYLVVEREQTVQIDNDFNQITYHFLCTNCNKEIKINHRQTILGVEKQCDFCSEKATVRSTNTNELLCDICFEYYEFLKRKTNTWVSIISIKTHVFI